MGRMAADDVDLQLVAGANALAQAIAGFEGDEVTAVDGVAEENARVEFGDDPLDARRVQSDRRVLARGAAAEVLAADDDLVGGDELVARPKDSIGWPFNERTGGASNSL